jgi:hypothetical protein
VRTNKLRIMLLIHRGRRQAHCRGIRAQGRVNPSAARRRPLWVQGRGAEDAGRRSGELDTRLLAAPQQTAGMAESRMGAVAGVMRQRFVSHPHSSNRTCAFPASGSPTGFAERHTETNSGRERRLRGWFPPSPNDIAFSEGSVSCRINRQLSGWNLPPLMMRAFGAHCHNRTLSLGSSALPRYIHIEVLRTRNRWRRSFDR